MKNSITQISWRSEIVVAVVFALVFLVGFYIGQEFYAVNSQSFFGVIPPLPSAARFSQAEITAKPYGQILLNNVTFICPASAEASSSSSARFIAAQFLKSVSGDKSYVDLELSDGRAYSLPQTVSADGARYANSGSSFVFWNKGNGAFLEENGTTTWSGCVTK